MKTLYLLKYCISRSFFSYIRACLAILSADPVLYQVTISTENLGVRNTNTINYIHRKK